VGEVTLGYEGVGEVTLGYEGEVSSSLEYLEVYLEYLDLS